MVDDDQPTEATDNPLPTTEIDQATGIAPSLAYSENTSTLPVVDYVPPRSLRTVWIIALVVVTAAVVAAATFFLGRSTAPAPESAVPASSTTAPYVTPSSTTAESAAPPVTVTVTPPPPVTATAAPPTPTTSVPPLATPEARIAEPIICSLHSQYPQMQPVDLAMTLIDRGIYHDYDEASLVVRLVLNDGCHRI